MKIRWNLKINTVLFAALLAGTLSISAQEIYVEVVQRSDPGGIFTETSTTALTTQSFTTRVAVASGDGYTFTHWTINDARVETTSSRALNPASFVISQAVDAVAHYLPTDEDSNSNSVPDWFEIRNYGTLTNSVDYDSDGDSITLAREYELELNPHVPNILDGGGMSIRCSDEQLTVVESNLYQYTEKSAPGGIFADVETMATNGEVVATRTAAKTYEDYHFAYWSINGIRQANNADAPVNPVSLAITGNVEVVAHYFPTAQDSNTNNIPDWWEYCYAGSLTNGVDSDADADGITFKREYETGFCPGVPNTLDHGGISVRCSDMQLTMVNSNLFTYEERSMPGGMFAGRELIVSNGQSIATADAPKENSGYHFAYWTVNDERQASGSQAAWNPLSLTVTGNMEVIAYYVPTTQDSNGNGILDWWELYNSGTLTNSLISDSDRDGITMEREYAYEFCPGVPNTLDHGGVSIRCSSFTEAVMHDPESDDDHDGIIREREYELGLSPYIPNTLDHGGISIRCSDQILADVQVSLGGFIEPSAVISSGAVWRIDGGGWLTNAQYYLMAAGDHLVEFRDVEGWEGPAPQTVSLFDQIIAITGTYAEVGMGDLKVNLEPEEARLAGAQWRIDGVTWLNTNGAVDTWYTNEASVLLTARQSYPYSVVAKDLSGWMTPPAQEGWLTNGEVTTLTMTYNAAGSLAVTAAPPSAASLGGWRVTNGTWYPFNSSQQLLIGDYDIEFKPVEGWIAPTSQPVTITQGGNLTCGATYEYDTSVACEPLPLYWKRTATASGEESDLYPAAYAVDGDLNSRWRSPASDHQWLDIELDRKSTMSGMTIHWDLGYAQAYSVELSADGLSWTNVYATTNSVGGTESVCWPPRKAQYVRLNLEERVYYQWGYSIWDIEFISPCGTEESIASTVSWTPEIPADDETVTVRYTPNDGPLAAVHASNVWIRYAANTALPSNGTDAVMTLGSNGVWTGTIIPAPGNTNIVFALHNGAGTWDNNGGTNWMFALVPGSNDVVRPNPGNMSGYRAYSNMTYLFNVTGTVSGTIWGTDVYRDLSPLAVAAVHAGALTNGEFGTVEVTLLGEQTHFTGSATNGVTSLAYGAWTGSYSVARYTGPELVLLGTNGAEITEGSSANVLNGTDFGRVEAGAGHTNTLYIVNEGQNDLIMSGWNISGTATNAFFVTGLPLTVAGGTTASVQIVYSPQVVRGEIADISLLNNTVRSNWTFEVKGTWPATLSVSGIVVNDKTYDGYIPADVASYGTLQGVVEPDDVTLETNRVEALFADADAGANKTVTLTGWSLSGADAYRYTLDEQTATASIFRAAQTIHFAEIPDQPWTNTVILDAEASSELPLTYTVSGPAVRNGSLLSFTSTGTVAVTASQTNRNWQQVSVTRTFEVYSCGTLTWTPESPRTGDKVTFAYVPNLSPLAGARTVYLGITNQPSDEPALPGPAMKAGLSNSWSAVYRVPSGVTNMQVFLYDEGSAEDTRRNAFWQVPVSSNAVASTGVLHVTTNRIVWAVNTNDWTPSTQSFVVENVGHEPLDFVVSNSSGWLDVTVETNRLGAGTGTTIEIDWIEQGLATGRYVNTLAFISTNAANSPQYLNVLLDVDISNAVAAVALTNLNQVYDGSEKSATPVTVPEGLAVDMSYSDVPLNAGDYTVTASLAEPGWLGGTTDTLVIAQASQTITFDPIGAQAVTNVVHLQASADSGLPVSFSVADGPAVLSEGTNLSFSGAGQVIITVTQAGNSNWLAATEVTNSFAVSRVAATVTLTNLANTYNGSACVVTGITEPSGLALRLTYDGSTNAPVNAGRYTVLADVVDDQYSGSASGTLVIAQASQTITFDPIGDQAVTNVVHLQASADSGLPVSFSVADGPAVLSEGTNMSFSGAGQVVITVSQAGNSNWLAAPEVTNSFAVSRVAATVTLTNLANTYNGSACVVTGITEPSGLALRITYDGNTNAPINAGSYTVLADVVDDQYSGSASGTLVIARADQVISVDLPYAASVTNSYDLNVRVTAASGLYVQYSGTGPLAVDSNKIMSFVATGTVEITFSQAGDDNWNAASNTAHTIIVTNASGTTECGLPLDAVVNESFETFARGEGADRISPWNAYAYSENGSSYVMSQGVGDMAFSGTNGVYVMVDDSDPGSYSGLVLEKTYVSTWALPALAERSNTLFRFALMETNGIPGWADMQLLDTNDNYISYRSWYYGNGWQVCEISLDKLQKPGWVAEFDENAIARIHVEYQPATPGIRTLVFDDISLDCGTYKQSAVTYEPHTVRETEPVQIIYAPNDHFFRYASQIQTRFWQNDQSQWVTTQSPMTQDVAGVWYGVYVPTGGVTYATFCFFDEGGHYDNHEQWNWNITVTPYRHQVQIDSAWGDVQPTNGTFEVVHNTIVTSTVPGVVENGYTQYLANGWAMSGMQNLSGSGTACVMTVTGDVSLAWGWSTSYWLNVSAETHGDVPVTSAWFAAASTATVSAVADEYYAFSGWSGDVPAENVSNMPLNLLMDQSRFVTASFNELVTGNTGTPYWWLAQYGWTNDFDTAAGDDQDGDDVPSWSEYIAGTDPTDITSLFYAPEFEQCDNGDLKMHWTSVSGHTYQVEYCDPLISVSNWWPLPGYTNVVATAPTNTLILPFDQDMQYLRLYRVQTTPIE